jgi:hypothetical protein
MQSLRVHPRQMLEVRPEESHNQSAKPVKRIERIHRGVLRQAGQPLPRCPREEENADPGGLHERSGPKACRSDGGDLLQTAGQGRGAGRICGRLGGAAEGDRPLPWKCPEEGPSAKLRVRVGEDQH